MGPETTRGLLHGKPPMHLYDLHGPARNAFDVGSIQYLGKWEGVWTLEISTFLGPKWHSPIGLMPFRRAQKSLDFQGPAPSHLPS
jgi:hypothetical protein